MYPWYLLMYVLVMSGIGFCLMGVDKAKAKRGKWRISEKTLFFSAALGGSMGAMLGMKVFHHKTKHWTFKAGMPAIFFLQCALCAGIFFWCHR